MPEVAANGAGNGNHNGHSGPNGNGAGARRPASLTLVPKADHKLSTRDFKSDQEVRWCPGCGDYAILAAVQGFMPELGVPRENIVFISGSGARRASRTT